MRIKRANSWTPPHLYDEHWLAYIMQKTVPGPGGCILWTGHKSYHAYPLDTHRYYL